MMRSRPATVEGREAGEPLQPSAVEDTYTRVRKAIDDARALLELDGDDPLDRY